MSRGPGAGAPDEGSAPGTASLDQILSWADHEIAAAHRRGEFDDLPGAGRPLAALEGGDDPDWWLKALIRREEVDLGAVLPGPLALRREREGFPDSLLHLPDEPAVRAALEEFNERVLADRRRPVAGHGSPAVVGRVDVEAMLARWVSRREETAQQRSRAPVPGTGPAGSAPAARRRWWTGRRRPGRADGRQQTP